MNPRRFRNTIRWIHLVLSAVLGVYLYSPWSSAPLFGAIVKFGIFPMVGITGVALWQQRFVQKLFAAGGTLRPIAEP